MKNKISKLYEYTHINNSFPENGKLVYVLLYDYNKNCFLDIKCFYKKGVGWTVKDENNKDFLILDRPMRWKEIINL